MATKRRPITTSTVTATKNYRMFTLSGENRSLDIKKHGRLKKSMQKYGYLKGFPIVCTKDGDSRLILKDGQHRLAIAESLGLSVYYIIEEKDFDVAEVNSTPIQWRPVDYANRYAENGLPDYVEGLEFCEINNLPVGRGFAILAGTFSYSNIKSDFITGKFKITNRKYASVVASLFANTASLSKHINNSRYLGACMAVTRVPYFDVKKMIRAAERCRDKLVSYSTRDAYLTMMEEIYNFGSKNKSPLKFDALQCISSRTSE